jgi:hypothetical protein
MGFYEIEHNVFKSWKFWVISLIVLLVLVAVVVLVNYCVSIYTKIEKPTGLQVYALPNGEKYIYVDKNMKAERYEFNIVFNEESPQIIKSKTNSVNVTEYMNSVGEFVISCKYLGVVEIADSDYCEPINYTNTIKISTPNISLDSQNNKLEFSLQDRYFDEVSLRFTLYYGVDANDELLYSQDYTLESNDGKGFVYGYFNLDFLQAGEYYLSLKAESVNNDYYLSSDLSAQIVYTKI